MDGSRGEEPGWRLYPAVRLISRDQVRKTRDAVVTSLSPEKISLLSCVSRDHLMVEARHPTSARRSEAIVSQRHRNLRRILHLTLAMIGLEGSARA